jgi:mycothiol synthase
MATTSPELTWLVASTPSVAAEVVALADAAATADGTAPLSEQVLRHLHRPDDEEARVEHLLARDAERALVGYAQLDRSHAADPVAELVVHPAHRRRGLGRVLLGRLIERDPAVRVWAHGGHPGAAELAARFGLRRDRELWRMRRSLREPPADQALPDGVRIRPFVVGADEAELLRVNNAAFAWHPEQGRWTLADVRVREDEPWFDPEGLLLAIDEADPARVLGFHWTKVHAAGADAPIGEVYVLGVDPGARGRRLGPALTLAGLKYLRGRGLDAVMLYVEADNTAAVRLYRDLGFAPWGVDVSYRH